MLNHGVVTGALFLCIGIIYERTHTRQIADYGGVATVLPVYAAFFMLFTLAAIGLPATNGFIGEFLIILGGFTASKIAGAFAATGIIVGAGYMLWLYQRVFFMDVNPKVSALSDITGRELLAIAPMAVLVFWIGIYPNAMLSFLHPSVANLLGRMQPGATGLSALTHFLKAVFA